MQPAPPETIARAREAVMALAPDGMRDSFGVMVELALAQMPADLLSKLVSDLESAHNADGSWNPDALIIVAKGFGMTDEMIAGYRESYGAMA